MRYSGTHPRRFVERYKELDPEAFPEMQAHVRRQGRTPAGSHVPVLLEEVLEHLAPAPGDVVVDCTLGHGGHAARLLERIGPEGRLIGLDIDRVQMQRTAQRLAAPNVAVRRSHFAGVAKVLAAEGLDGADVVLADLGVSSMQLDDPARGFSYKHDGPLDMRMDDRLPRTAADVLAALAGEELAAHLRELADEPHAERIARAIVRRREQTPITTTRQLTQIIVEATGQRAGATAAGRDAGALHPAARTFQALRILVNDEMGGLEQFLRVVPYCLRPGGRVGIISFHSGEHRRVDDALRRARAAGVYAAVADAPVRPGGVEVGGNPRARSAQLRWARRGRD
ncbi:MAG TPA: 16S rRNA (cytosine(1402)-N(4))-methyltransferase RsmH [Phycisphaerae bacterium]|nr:16S rRNA (cytosine(1402)-N(4))-methyltransferase RsmH [Phycisphaerae bacterium]